MGKYIRAEFYKVLHRSYTWIFLAVMLAGETLLVAGWVFTNSRGNTIGFASGVGTLAMMLSTGLYCTILVGDLVFSEQYKIGTLKNEVSFGLGRGTIYLGKLAVECVTALAFCAVLLGYYLAACWITLLHDPQTDTAMLKTIGYCILCALPLWLGCQALANACYFLLRSSTVAAFSLVGLVMALPEIFKLSALLLSSSALSWAGNNLFFGPLLDRARGMAPWDGGFLGQCVLVGAAWFAAATALGILGFRKKEVN